MKYITEVTIRVPREKVIALFDSTENLYKWQPGLKGFEHLSGEPGKEGAESRMVFAGRKGDLVMTETPCGKWKMFSSSVEPWPL